MEAKNPFSENKYEIIYHVINFFLAIALVIAGALADGNLTKSAVITAIVAGLIVAFTKLRDYWIDQEKSYKTPLVNS